MEKEEARINTKQDRERFSVSHASKDFEKTKILQMKISSTSLRTSRGKSCMDLRKTRVLGHNQAPDQSSYTTRSSHISISLRPLSLDGAQWRHIKHTMDDLDTSPLGLNIQHELTQQLSWDKGRKHRSYMLEGATSSKRVIPSHQIPGGHSPNHPTLFQKCRRGYGERGPQPHNQQWSNGQA